MSASAFLNSLAVTILIVSGIDLKTMIPYHLGYLDETRLVDLYSPGYNIEKERVNC
jgi:hypothetical protein